MNPSNPSNRIIELIPIGFESGEPLNCTDATPVALTMVDDRGKEYIVRFTFRNDFTALISTALKRLIPVKRVH
jgi:hypothetical protein